MQTKQTHDKTLILLMGVGAGILLLAAFGLFLIQSPDSPLPWEKATQTSTDTLVPPTATVTQTLVPTSTGTRLPSRTPLKLTDTPSPSDTSVPASPTAAPTTALPTTTHTLVATATATMTQVPAQPSVTQTPLPPTTTDTPEPTATTAPTATLSPTPLTNPILVTGRVVNQDTPLENVTITFEVDISSSETEVMTTTTGVDGVYQFEVGWKNKSYALVFSLESNPQLSPSNDYVTWSWIEGTLLGDIEAPDLEISALPKGNRFIQTEPADGASVSASQLSLQTPLTFAWVAYPQAEQYWVDLGPQGDSDPSWSSIPIMDPTVDWDGNLTNGVKVGEGTYWWAVGALRTKPGFYIYTYTHNWTLLITP